MLLHILNRTPASSLIYRDTLRSMGIEDRLLLIEDAVYGAIPPLFDQFSHLQGRLYALRDDLISRGLEERCSERVRVVTMQEFVSLTEEAEQTVSWF